MTSRRRALALALLSLVACARASTVAPTRATSPDITEADLRRRLFLIADDSMMGRESGSEGAYKTTEYIADEFRRLGLEPAGENGTYFQTVPLWRGAIDTASRLQVGDASLVLGRDFVTSTIRATPRVLENVSVVYGGSLADSAQWIPAGQAAGKVVVLNVPDGTNIVGLGPRLQRWSGVQAVAIVALERLPLEEIARQRGGRPVADTSRNPSVVPVLWISRRAANTLMGVSSFGTPGMTGPTVRGRFDFARSEEHTSELQSLTNLVCRL